MVRIPTPIPESFVASLKQLLSGAAGDVLWRLFVSLLLIGLIALLSQLGVFGALIGSALFASLYQDDVRAFVMDIWNRDFWIWRV